MCIFKTFYPTFTRLSVIKAQYQKTGIFQMICIQILINFKQIVCHYQLSNIERRWQMNIRNCGRTFLKKNFKILKEISCTLHEKKVLKKYFPCIHLMNNLDALPTRYVGILVYSIKKNTYTERWKFSYCKMNIRDNVNFELGM